MIRVIEFKQRQRYFLKFRRGFEGVERSKKTNFGSAFGWSFLHDDRLHLRKAEFVST